MSVNIIVSTPLGSLLIGEASRSTRVRATTVWGPTSSRTAIEVIECPAWGRRLRLLGLRGRLWVELYRGKHREEKATINLAFHREVVTTVPTHHDQVKHLAA